MRSLNQSLSAESLSSESGGGLSDSGLRTERLSTICLALRGGTTQQLRQRLGRAVICGETAGADSGSQPSAKNSRTGGALNMPARQSNRGHWLACQDISWKICRSRNTSVGNTSCLSAAALPVDRPRHEALRRFFLGPAAAFCRFRYHRHSGGCCRSDLNPGEKDRIWQRPVF